MNTGSRQSSKNKPLKSEQMHVFFVKFQTKLNLISQNQGEKSHFYVVFERGFTNSKKSL